MGTNFSALTPGWVCCLCCKHSCNTQDDDQMITVTHRMITVTYTGWCSDDHCPRVATSPVRPLQLVAAVPADHQAAQEGVAVDAVVGLRRGEHHQHRQHRRHYAELHCDEALCLLNNKNQYKFQHKFANSSQLKIHDISVHSIFSVIFIHQVTIIFTRSLTCGISD